MFIKGHLLNIGEHVILKIESSQIWNYESSDFNN